MADDAPPPPKRVTRIPAVPWTTPTEEKVKGALGEVPAYVRRARRLEEAVASLFEAARQAREELLLFVALRFRQVLDLLEDEEARELPVETIEALGAILDEIETLEAFCRLRQRPRQPGRREIDKALDALRESVRRFNAKWVRWVAEEAPLDEVNRQVEGYNENYAFEKQCAVKYVPLNKLRVEKKTPLTEADLLERFPSLPVP
jgi:hypothetical protein